MIPLCIECRFLFTKNDSDEDRVSMHGHTVYPNMLCVSPNNVRRDFVSGSVTFPLCSRMNDRGQCASWKPLPQTPVFSTDGNKLTLTSPVGDRIYWALNPEPDGVPQFQEYTDPIPFDETTEFLVYTETFPFRGLDGEETVLKSVTSRIECTPSDTDSDESEDGADTEETTERAGE